MLVAVIPARGGSKRIPKKNIKTFRGKPMIAWAVGVAKESRLFDHVVVSTDDSEIANVAMQYGADVPFMRPAELADDFAGTTGVMAHATRWAIDAGWEPSAVCCIYPTSPLLLGEDLKRGLTALTSGDWSYAMSVTDFAAPIFRSFRQLPEGGLEMFFPEHFMTRSQDLPVALHDAGQMYWGRPAAWMEERRLFERHTIPVFIPRWRVQDIDTPDDWQRAELVHRLLTTPHQST